MYYGARYYDTTLGRFTQADTIVSGALNPQSLNRYAYTLNNPVRYTDPTGHMCDDPDDCWIDDEPGDPPEDPEGPTQPTHDEYCAQNPNAQGCNTPAPADTGANQDGNKEKDKKDDESGGGVCQVDPSEAECNPYNKAIEVAKGLCLSSTPTCYYEQTWFLVDVYGGADSHWMTLGIQQSLSAYDAQGLDPALIVDQGIDNPLDLVGKDEYGLAGQITVNSYNWVTAGFLTEIGLDSRNISNYEPVFLMEHIARNPRALYNSAYACATNLL